MDLSGIIFVVLAVAWAVYLIPKALKHHDEVARTRSIDRFSSALRVIARREPVNGRDARLVVPRAARPSGAAAPAAVPVSAPTVAVRPAVPAARLRARRAAARAAARRRRRILSGLLVLAVAMVTAAYFTLVPWWSVAVPAGLTLVFLVLCRTQVQRETLRDFEVLVARSGTAAAEPGVAEAVVMPKDAMVPEDAEVHQVAVAADRVAEFDDTEDTVGIPVALLDAVVVPTEDGGTLWDPLPVTLPTYVTKPQARRTVRTIDLGEPGTWTSGRTAEDAELVASAAAAEQATAATAPAEQRAVGS